MNDFVVPPLMAPPLVVTPVAGLNHSTFSARVVALRFTVNVPPLGAYTRYSAPVAALSARQNPVDDRPPCGVALKPYRLRHRHASSEGANRAEKSKLSLRGEENVRQGEPSLFLSLP